MTTYRIRVGFHNPSALTLRQLDDHLAEHRFCKTRERNATFRYFLEYEYHAPDADYCTVCSLAYNEACKVRKCPLVLVEEKGDS